MMNKKEVIEEIEKEKSNFNAWEHSVRNRALDDALAIVRKLDEPEKPVVPQFVADWYEEHKTNFELYLSELCMNFIYHRERLNDKLANWYEQLENKPIQTLVNMHQFGYEVQKEKQYVVAIPDDGRNGFIQLWKNREGKLLFNFEDKMRYGKVHLLTEKEIKQKDERLWQFAEEVNNDD